MKPDQLQDRLGLNTLKDRTWYIQPCSATKGNLFLHIITNETPNSEIIQIQFIF